MHLVRCFSDSVEELLKLLFQPAICQADNVFPLKIAFLHLDHHLTHGSLVSPKSTIQLDLNRFSFFCTAQDCDRTTDRQTCYSICNSTLHLHSSEMWHNNKLCNIVVTDGTNQSHNISEIYTVHLYQSTTFLNAIRMKITPSNRLTCWHSL